VDGCAGGGLLDHRQAQLGEQDLAELLGGAQVEGLAGQHGPAVPARAGGGPVLGMLGEQEVVDEHAVALHLEEHPGGGSSMSR
jgi:hypothetical protein